MALELIRLNHDRLSRLSRASAQLGSGAPPTKAAKILFPAEYAAARPEAWPLGPSATCQEHAAAAGSG